MMLGAISFRDLRKRYLRTIGSLRWERRLKREIDQALSDPHKKPVLPDFLIIGAPKCATSWLQAALSRHPRIRMVPEEIEYFSVHVDRPPALLVSRAAASRGATGPCGPSSLSELSNS